MEEFDIYEFVKYYLNKLIIVVLCGLIGLFIGWYYTANMKVPMYRSETSFVLTRSNNSSGLTQSDVNLNKNLVSTYREIIKSRRIVSKVIKNLKLDVSYEELKERINVTSANDTELIVISVADKNSNLAKDIANKIASTFQEEIPEIYSIENISIVDTAIASSKPYNINVKKQSILGLGVGFILSSLVIFVIFYFDDSIKNAAVIEERVKLNVLSSIPVYRPKGSKK